MASLSIIVRDFQRLGYDKEAAVAWALRCKKLDQPHDPVLERLTDAGFPRSNGRSRVRPGPKPKPKAKKPFQRRV